MATLPDMPDADQVLIDQHLSAALQGPAAEEFARRVTTDPAFAANVARQQSLASSLTRAIPLPDADLPRVQLARAIATLEHGTTSPSLTHSRFRRTTLLAIAACLLLGLGAATWLSVLALHHASAATTSPLARISADGFRPAIALTDPAEIETTLAQKLGTPFTLPREPDIAYLGIRSDVDASPVGAGILAIVKGEQVLLVLDRVKPSSGASAPASEPDFRHTREISRLHLTEWSRSRVPLLMDKVVVPAR